MPAERETPASIIEQMERKVVDGDRLIARQREIIAELEARGEKTVSARRQLIDFLERQIEVVAVRDRCRKTSQGR